MDAAGLAIGAAALMTLFKTCLEMCDTIESGRRYGSDFEVLTTKVGIERVRLLLWGDSVGLPGLDLDAGGQPAAPAVVDSRLQDPRVVRAVCDILGCMRQLFEDTGSMTRRYGLQNTQTDAASSGSLGNALATTFRRTYARFQESAVQTQRAATVVTTARWAIKDKRRFQRFIEELREFNDSLCALFPDLDEHVRREMAGEIKTATNLEDLQIVEQAVTDMEASDELAEAASVRITELSQHTRSLAGNDPDTETINETLETEEGDGSTAAARGVNVKRLAKQLEKLEVVLRASLKGSLQLSIWHAFGGRYTGFLAWEGFGDDEYHAQVDKQIEYRRPSYPAWTLMYAPDKTQNEQGNWADHDSEASRKYEGRYPGTRTVEGYAADFSDWARANEKHEAERVWVSVRELPRHKVVFLAERLRLLQLQRSLPWSEEAIRKDVEALIGPSGFTPSGDAAAGGYWRTAKAQVSEILRVLNRDDVFGDLRGTGSLAAAALAPPGPSGGGGGFGFANFLFQMVLAYQLKLLVARERDAGFGNYGARVAATVAAAERWVDGVLVRVSGPKRDYVEMFSLVHERQVEGLVRFAELMAWPALGEMRGFIEDAYANLRAGVSVGFQLWDWLFGTMLPGNAFVYTIMSALVAASPSLSGLGAPKYFASGLVLDDRSYWRAKFVVGRVLGGLRGVKAANGWVGPCPVPTVAETGEGEGQITKGWWRVHARDVAFKKPEHLPPHADADEGASFSNLDRVAGETSKADWVRAIGDQSKWIVPIGPSGAPDVVEFRALRLKPLRKAADPGVAVDGSGYGGGVPGTGDGVGPDISVPAPEPDPEEPETAEPLQRASVELAINGAAVSFTLYNAPVFVAAPRCIDGPHAVHERDLPKLRHIRRVGQLPGHVHGDERVLVIDATGQGECELAARAWCAEYGQHAVVRRAAGTCFACAVRAASHQGLGLGCLIWA